MPTNVASLITGDNYDPVVNIPANGETITEAAEINTAVALGNRIEYIRRRTLDVAPFPEQIYILREDFDGVAYDSVNLILWGNQTWKHTITGPASVSFSAGTVKNPGTLDLLMNGASNQDLFFAPNNAAANLPFTGLEQLTVAAKLTDGAANTTSTLFVGVRDPSTGDRVGLSYNAGLDKTHWLFERVRNVPFSSQFTQLIGLTAATYVVMQLLKNAAGDWEIYANHALVTTVPAANFPSAGGTPSILMHHGAADPQVFSTSIDFAYARGAIADRSGP